MIKTKLIIFCLILSYIATSVYSFSIDEINKTIKDSYNIDLQWDKVNYKFSKQDQLIKDSNWWYISIWRDSYVDSWDNLNLNNIIDPNIEDNSQQWESTNEYDNSIIPINYWEKRNEIIQNNIIMKKNNFIMDNYEKWAIQVRNKLQRYYNKEVTEILLWWIPSTFWLWKDSVISSSPSDNFLINNEQINNNSNTIDCSQSCNCWQYYSSYWVCHKIPPNSTTTWNSFKCNKGYTKSNNTCVKQWSNNSKYKWAQPINWSDDPFWVKVKNWSKSGKSNTNLWIYNTNYSSSNTNIINNFNSNNYLNIINSSSSIYCENLSNKEDTYFQPCKIYYQSTIYNVPR
jgi:hypothetical protein